jgi:pSer/pThr/pTyr-binding forkhead associated (FHA) protein
MRAPLSPHGSTPAELRERLELERRGTAFLAWRDPSGRQCLAALDEAKARFTIGRGPDNDIALTWDSRASRVHAIVERAGGEWLVVDDGISQNGTWIGELRISGHRRLGHRDVLRIGDTLVAFSDPGHAASAATSRGHDLRGVVALTAMQRAVLVALCRPFANGAAFATPATNQEIGTELHLTVEAVKTHLRTLFRKFAIADVPQNQKRLQLAEAALKAGLVSGRDFGP